MSGTIDIDRIARAVDLRKMGPRGLAQIIETMDLLSKAETGIDLAEVRTETLVWLLSGASTEQLRELAASPAARNAVLDEAFRRMATMVKTDKAASVSGVIRWRIDCDADDYLRFQTVLADGTLVTGTSLDQQPTVTVTVSFVDFLRLAAGATGPVRLAALRRLRMQGELSFALRFLRLLDVPKARRPRP